MDPLSQVYTGQDNSGAAIIYGDNTPDPIPTVLGILQKKAQMAAAAKIAAAKASKTNAYKDTPNYAGASYDTPYLTKVRNDLVEKSRPLYDGSLTDAQQKAQLAADIDVGKGNAFMMAHKSAKLDEEFQKVYKDYSDHPWSYGPDFEQKAKEWIGTPLEKRGIFQYKKRNESDYVKSMQDVDIKPNITAWDQDVANGRMLKTEQHKLVKGAIDKGWKLWSSNTKNPDVIALYDHADEELRKKWGDKYDQFEPERKYELINSMGKQMFAESQGIKLGADGNWVTSYKTDIQNAPKGAKIKQKTIDEMSDIQYDSSYNTKTKGNTAKMAASYTVVHPKKNTTVLQLSSEMYDPLSKKKVTETGPITFTPGQIHVGEHITTNGTSVERPFVTGTYKASVPVLDKDGKPAKDMNDVPKTKTVEKSIIVPLKDMEGVFIENGEQYQWAYDLAEKLNMEKISGKQSTGFDYSNIK